MLRKRGNNLAEVVFLFDNQKRKRPRLVSLRFCASSFSILRELMPEICDCMQNRISKTMLTLLTLLTKTIRFGLFTTKISKVSKVSIVFEILICMQEEKW